MEHYVLKLYKVYVNDDLRVDLDLCHDNVKFGKTCFCTNSKPRYQVSVQDHWSSGYAPNFEKVGDILVSVCPSVCVYVCVCVWGMEISS